MQSTTQGGLGGSGGTTKLGTEYGKNFESGERRPLPGLVSLLPGESSGHVEEVEVAARNQRSIRCHFFRKERRRKFASQRGVAALLSSGEQTTPDAPSGLENVKKQPIFHANRESVESLEAEGKKQTFVKAEDKPNIEFSNDSENEEEKEARSPLVSHLCDFDQYARKSQKKRA
uniref:Uncharacterized protein n=1 Tax=Ditylenchus dipsaci TaxID=166011 RepID=A0A915D824_9BILA